MRFDEKDYRLAQCVVLKNRDKSLTDVLRCALHAYANEQLWFERQEPRTVFMGETAVRRAERMKEAFEGRTKTADGTFTKEETARRIAMSSREKFELGEKEHPSGADLQERAQRDHPRIRVHAA